LRAGETRDRIIDAVAALPAAFSARAAIVALACFFSFFDLETLVPVPEQRQAAPKGNRGGHDAHPD